MSTLGVIFFPWNFVPFRASELALPRNSEYLGMSTFFRGITETVPSLFRGIFSERNSVPNPRSEGRVFDSRWAQKLPKMPRLHILLHKVRKYEEYHSVCPLVGIGTLPIPLSPASVPLPQNRGKRLSARSDPYLWPEKRRSARSGPDLWPVGRRSAGFGPDLWPEGRRSTRYGSDLWPEGRRSARSGPDLWKEGIRSAWSGPMISD